MAHLVVLIQNELVDVAVEILAPFQQKGDVLIQRQLSTQWYGFRKLRKGYRGVLPTGNLFGVLLKAQQSNVEIVKVLVVAGQVHSNAIAVLDVKPVPYALVVE